jgi:hypothetical protein
MSNPSTGFSRARPLHFGAPEWRAIIARRLRDYTTHFNGMQPWKVARDGSVHNAMFS